MNQLPDWERTTHDRSVWEPHSPTALAGIVKWSSCRRLRPGVVRAVMPRPDDFELYLLHLATEYVSATRDVDFLAQKVSMYGETATHTVLEGLIKAARPGQCVLGLVVL